MVAKIAISCTYAGSLRAKHTDNELDFDWSRQMPDAVTLLVLYKPIADLHRSCLFLSDAAQKPHCGVPRSGA